MKIKSFGKLAQIIDKEIKIEFPLSIVELKTHLETQFPLLKNYHYQIAINHEIITNDGFLITNPETIALLPPFSGG